ncbi:MAG: TetR/AcrR family transcriptional regulator [Desulfofustis sp.]|jgi:AcrR family transcriptional regulator|nr:TetR/AcrR family transcriptional regulator [Desulfofustis sp.]
MHPVREQNKINKRKAIIDAAIKLFSRNGYEQTSIEELAREAGVGKGTVYSYFQTKKEIVHAFCEAELDFTRSELAAHTNPESSLQEQLLVIFMAEFKHITENRDFGRIYLQESVFPREHHGEADLEMQNQYFEILYPIYRGAQRRGELRSDLELLHIAGHFWALHLLVLSCWYNGMIPTEEVPEAMKTLINQAVDGLKPSTI